MMTSSADFFGNFGCGSIGMPRPLSVTDRKPSAVSSTSMKVAWPAERLVHRVVDHLGEQVVERLLVGAADIHARPAADRFQTLQNLDARPPYSRLRRPSRTGRQPSQRRDPLDAGASNRSSADLFLAFRFLRLGHGSSSGAPVLARRIGCFDYATDRLPMGTAEGSAAPAVLCR